MKRNSLCTDQVKQTCQTNKRIRKTVDYAAMARGQHSKVDPLVPSSPEPKKSDADLAATRIKGAHDIKRDAKPNKAVLETSISKQSISLCDDHIPQGVYWRSRKKDHRWIGRRGKRIFR